MMRGLSTPVATGVITWADSCTVTLTGRPRRSAAIGELRPDRRAAILQPETRRTRSVSAPITQIPDATADHDHVRVWAAGVRSGPGEAAADARAGAAVPGARAPVSTA